MVDTNSSPAPATLRGVLDAYTAAGFSGSFTVEEGARLRCNACSTIVAASAVTMDSLRRLEGASDPDDMLAVVAVTCPNCATPGTLILGFGPAASPEDGDVLTALRDERNSGELPGHSAPGEAAGDASAIGR